MMRVPIGDFHIGKEERAAIDRVAASGRISEGREVRAFEDEFAEWVGAKHCVAVSSGTAALMVGLRALAVSRQFKVLTEGARVLLPALTFIATANAAHHAGMRVFFGDIEPETMCLDPAAISKIRTEIVLPVHLMGFSADLSALQVACKEQTKPPVLVEDACEAHGTTYNGRQVGTFGAWGAFSFYFAHTVQAGELGCIVTDSADIATIARQLKAHGRECSCRICTRTTTGCPALANGRPDPRFRAQYIGWNCKTTEWSAALARVQLQNVERNMGRRIETRYSLYEQLQDLEGCDIELIPFAGTSVPMAFPIILKRSGYRDRVVSELERRGVEARPLFGCIPTQQPAYAGRMGDLYHNRLPVAEHYGADGFYVGCHQYLTGEQVEYMAETIKDVITEVVT